MPAVGTVTIAWDIRDPITTLPATGHVRVHIPHTLRDTTNHVLYGSTVSAWIPLVAGLGSVQIPDPHDPAISPTSWTPVVEVQANVLNTAWPIVIPPGSAGTTIHLDTKAPAVTVPAVFDYALASTVTALDARVDALEGGGAGESGPPLTAADVGAEPAGATAALAATLAPVATAGTYASLTGKPTIPAVPGDIGAQPAGSYATTTALTSGLAGKDAAGTAVAAVAAHTGATDPHPQYLTETEGDGRYAALGAGRIRHASTGLVSTSFTASSGAGGAWTVCPPAYRVTIPAAVGDVLRWEPAVIANPGDSGYELDLAALNGGGTPARYASSRTSTQATNGHGGLYMGGAYSRTMRGLTWTVEAGDIVSGSVTLALLYRAGSGMTVGSGAYPSEIGLTNHGTPS